MVYFQPPVIDFVFLTQKFSNDLSQLIERAGFFKEQTDLWFRLLQVEMAMEDWRSALSALGAAARGMEAQALEQLCEAAQCSENVQQRVSYRQDIEFCISIAIIDIQRWEYRQKFGR